MRCSTTWLGVHPEWPAGRLPVGRRGSSRAHSRRTLLPSISAVRRDGGTNYFGFPLGVEPYRSRQRDGWVAHWGGGHGALLLPHHGHGSGRLAYPTNDRLLGTPCILEPGPKQQQQHNLAARHDDSKHLEMETTVRRVGAFVHECAHRAVKNRAQPTEAVHSVYANWGVRQTLRVLLAAGT